MDAAETMSSRRDALDSWARHAAGANGFGGHPEPPTDIEPESRSQAMQAVAQPHVDTSRYARTVEVSKRIRWDIDRDVIRGRDFDYSRTFLPRGLTFADRLPFLSPGEQLTYSQVQGRTYAKMFGLIERAIGAKVLEISHDHWLGDQVALEALVRMTDEELKHQELFRRLETMIARGMPEGYRFVAEPNPVAQEVLSKSTWAVLALICNIELFTQSHYRTSIEPDDTLSPLFKDVLLFHWKEESQHAILDELEWARENEKLTDAQRDAAVDDLIALVGAVDGIVQAQAAEDTRYFARILNRPMFADDAKKLGDTMLAAYRWQYILSGVAEPRFQKLITSMTTPAQMQRIGTALAPLAGQ